MIRFASLLLLAACAQTPPPAPPAPPQPISLTEADARHPVIVETGAMITVRLNGQAGTGYSWEIAPPAGIVLIDQSNSSTAPPRMVGGSMSQTFRLRADAPGSYLLHFSYDRPWAGGEKGANLADFPVTVR